MTHNKKFQKVVFKDFTDNFESLISFVTKNTKFWNTEVAITAYKYCITNARKYK